MNNRISARLSILFLTVALMGDLPTLFNPYTTKVYFTANAEIVNDAYVKNLRVSPYYK